MLPDEAHRDRPALGARATHQLQRLVEIGGEMIAVAGIHSSLDPGAIDVDAEEDAAVHRGRERLGAAHAAQPAGHHQAPRQRAAEMLARAFREGLVGPLQDALRPDVDPAAGGHLAVHREAERVEPPELVPGGPAGHQVGVGDEDARRLLMRAEDADRLAALDQQRLVVLQPPKRLDDPVVAGPVARGLAAAAVDDELLGTLRHLGVEVVHEHPEGGFLVPSLAGDGGAPGGADRRVRGGRHGHGLVAVGDEPGNLTSGLAFPNGPQGAAGRYPGPRTTRPGMLSVGWPSRRTGTPLTHTSRTPVAYWCGSAKVARSVMVAGSNTTTSA